MASHADGFNGSTFETLENRFMLTGAFPSAAQNAIVYDSHDNLDVAYYDSTAHNLKFVQEAANGTWSQPVVIDGSSSDVGKDVTIAINGAGFPAVAYQDTANSDLKFAQYNGTTWTTTVVDKRKTTGFNPSLAFDKLGAAYISYYKQNTGDLDLATQKAGAKKWTLSTLQSAGNVGQISSIAINPVTNKPSIAYTNAKGLVQYIAKTGNGFAKPVTVGTVAKSTTGSVSLAFNGSAPAVGFVNAATGEVDLGQLSGKKFATTDVATVSTDGSNGAQVLIDPTTNMPEVVYHDSTGVYLSMANSDGTTTITQVSTGGSDTIAAVQPGSGSLVFSTVSTTGGTLSVNTTVAPPAAPSNVAAAAASPTTVAVTWTDNSNDEAGFLIERSAEGTNFTTVATTQPNVTSYTDTGLTEATVYYYRVSAIGAAGNNSAGTTDSGGGQIVPAAGIATTVTLPSAPTGVAAAAASDTTTTLRWTNTSQAPTGFIINRSSDGGSTFAEVGSVGATVASFTDSGLAEGTAYTYDVEAYNASGGTTSTSASTYTLPATPTGITASASSDTSITVGWTNASAVAGGFIVQRSTDGTTFTTIATPDAGATSFLDTGLSENTAYYYRIEAVGPGGLDSTPSTVTNAVTNPSAPSNVVTTARSTSRIDLSWTNNSADATGYIVQRSSGGADFITVGTPSGIGSTQFSDTGLVEGITYTYRVEAVDTSTMSAFSPTVSSVTLPAAPTGLEAAASGLQVTVTWNDNSSSETSFQVQRSSDNGANWSTLMPSAPANATSTATYVDSTPSQGATYTYRVKAVNSGGSSAYTGTAQATIAPAAPSGLTAVATSATQIHLSWMDNSLGETGIVVEQYVGGPTQWMALTTTTAFATSFDVSGLTAGTTYQFRISAMNGGGSSTYSTASGLTSPSAPASVNATAASTSEIDLSWSPVSSATSYIIQRTLGDETTTLNPVSNTTYADQLLSEGTQYSYTVTAVNAGGSSVASSPTVATTLPAAPSDVQVTGVNPTTVDVSWQNNSLGYTGILVQRSADGGTTWSTVGNPTIGQTSIVDTGVAEAHSYIFQVTASNAGGPSAAATSSTFTTVPAAPTALSATATSASNVVLNWTNNSSGATGYVVERGTDGENFGTTFPVDSSTHTFTDTSASAATNYYYRVYATGIGGPSGYSNNAQATTIPAIPQNLTATGASATVVNLAWSPVSGATGYSILRSTDGVNYSPWDNSSTNSYSDTSAIESTTYSYEVVANNGTGSSPASAPSASVTTVPSAPSSLMVTSSTASQVDLSWQNTSHAITGFSIERSDDNGTSFSQVGTALSTDTTYTDTFQIEEGSHYIYRIRAVGPGGSSATSNTAGADTIPAAPTNLTTTATSATSITVSWTDASTNATGYVVARSDNGGPFNAFAPLSGSATSFTDTVTQDSSYQYEVRAIQLLSDNVTTLTSPWTGPQTITSPPEMPANVQATVISASEVDVTWANTSATATSFNILRSNAEDGYDLLHNVDVSTTLYADTTALAGTQYTYEVVAVGVNGNSFPGVSSPLTSISPVPTNVSASDGVDGQVLVSWDDVPGESSFHIQRNDNGGGWMDLTTVGQGITSYTDTSSVENDSYQYRVQATNASGSSAYSTPASVSTFLSAPTGVTIASTTSSEVDISWTDTSSSAMGYEVQRSDNGGSWQSLTTSLSFTTTTFQDTTVADGVSYQYRVRGLSIAGDSDFAASTSTTTPLLAPTNLAATSVSTTRVDLSWTNPSATATSFQIWRSIGGADFAQFDTTTNTTYSDTSLTAGESASYEVFAANAITTSAASGPVTGVARPVSPTNLAVSTIGTSPTSLSLTWTDNSSGATGYQIYRDSGMGLTLLTTVSGADSNSYTDTGLTEGSSYTYQIYAVNDGGQSGASNSSSNTTYCSAPTGLTVSAAGTTSIDLEWTDTSANANGYTVAMSTDGGDTFNAIAGSAILGPSDTTYTVTSLTEATQYQFQVYAYNGTGNSATSNTLTATTIPNAPTINYVAAYENGPVISWTNHSANPTGYIVQRSSDGGATFDQSFDIAAGTTGYQDTSAATNTSYTYQVLATDAGGNSAPSSTAGILTIPAQVTNFTVTVTGSTSAHLSWTPDANGAAYYNIERSGGLFGMDDGIGSALSGATSFDDTTAVPGKTYTYFITAGNGSGDLEAVESAPVTILTAAPTLSSPSATATTVSLQWGDVNGETGFVLQRSADGVSNWQTIATPATGQTTYTDTGLTQGTTYYYQIAGTDSTGTGDFSTATALATLPAAPTGLTTTSVSATEVDLTWTDNTDGATGYDVYRADNGLAAVRIAHGLAANATSYQDTTQAGGNTSVYSVYAYDAGGSSAAATQTALVIPGQPQMLAGVAPSSSEIDLTWNSVFGAANYTIARSPDGSTNWQQLAQVDSSTLSYNDTDAALTEGTTYYYTVTASNATGSGVAATVNAPTLPAGVVSLSISSSSPTAVHLSWVDNSSGATGYHVYRQTNNAGMFALVDTINDPSTTTFDDTVTEGTAYTYRVQPFDASGDGAASDINITTVPATPALTAATPASNTTVTLTWTNNSANAANYIVKRAPFGSSTWTTLTSALPGSAIGYSDTTASGGNEYQYKVIAHGAGGNSADSNIIDATTYTDAVTTLGTAAASTTEIDLTWAAVNGATGYNILRSTDGTNFAQVDSVGAGATSYQDTNQGVNLTEGTRYYYQVAAVDAAGASSTGNTSYTSTWPLAPSGLTATAVSDSQIDLQWTNNSAGFQSVTIEISTNNVTWTQAFATGNSNSFTYDSSGLTSGSTYYYRVAAVNEGGTSYMTDVPSVSAITLADAPALTATAVNDGTVSLNWDTSTGATTYTVQHSTDGVSWADVETATADTSAIDTALTGNTNYQYRILASNGSGDGAYGTPITVLTVPDVPSSVVATSPTPTSVSLMWAGDSGANVKYSVYRAPVSGGVPGTYVKIGSVTGALAYTDTGVTAATTYSYEIAASNASGQNAIDGVSNQILTVPAAVTALSSSVVSATEVDLTWADSTGATSYTVSRIAVGDGGYTLLTGSPLSSSATSYNDTAALSGTSYTYKVTAINATGGTSATAAALTYPAVPAGFTVSITDNHDIAVAWNAVTGATSYTLQRQINSGSWVTVTGYSGTSLTDVVAGGNTYAYQVKATDATGDSAFASASAVTTVPDAVTNVAITASATTDTSITLTWSLSSGAAGYVVERSDDGGNTFPTLSSTLSSSTTTYTDTSLSEMTPYMYKVVASNTGGNSADSSIVSVTTLPTAPSGLATTLVTVSEVDLTWNDNSGGLAGFDVQRNDGGWHTLATTDAGVSTFNDTTVASGTNYSYRIIADNGSVLSAPTASLPVLTLAAAPTDFAATQISTTEVDLSWTASTGATTYDITYSINGGAYNPLTTGVTDDSYAFTAASAGTTYQFAIVANDGTGPSASGASNSATTVPVAPTSLATTGVSTSEVDLSWDDVTGATAYEVDRQNFNGSWSTLTDSLADDATGYPDTGLASGTTYAYRVEAIDAGGSSAAASTTGVTLADAPASIVATPISTGEVDLAWAATTGATTYDITYSINGGSYNSLTAGVASNSYAFTAAAAGTNYQFKIVANDASGASAPGSSNTTLTVPAAPAGFAASVASANEVDLTWSISTSATGYTIEREQGTGGFTTLQTGAIGGGATSYADTSVSDGTGYSYIIYATDATGNSPTSSAQTVLTLPATVSLDASVVSDTEIDLTWPADTGTVTAYEVWRADNDSGTFAQVSGELSPGTLSFNDTGLANATDYVYRVLAVNDTGDSANDDTATLTTLAAAPTGFAASSASASEIDLTWSQSSGATGYQVEVQAGSEWDNASGVLASSSDSYPETGLDAGTSFTYRVVALDAGGPSDPSNSAAAETLPDVAGNFTATVASDSEIDLSWDSVTGANSYKIMRSTGGGYSTLTSVSGTTYSDTALSENSEYDYEIVATDDGGDGSATAPQDVTTLLTAPSVAVSDVTSTGATLTWTDNSAAETGYKVEQQNPDSSWSDIGDFGSLSGTGTTGDDVVSGLTEATEYHFRVTAVSGGSNDSLATPATVATAPADPSDLAVTTNSATSVTLTWTNNSANNDSFQIDRSSNAGVSWTPLTTPGASDTSYTDTAVAESSAYSYRVSALFEGTASGYSSTTITTLPSAPTAVTSTAVSATEIDLAWTDTSANATAYRAYSSTDDQTFTQVGSDLADNATSYADMTASENATTYYKVVAVDGGGESIAATTSATTPLAAPSAVTASTTTDVTTGDKTIDISWSNNSTVATSIKIERGVAGVYTPLVTLAHTATSYVDDSGLENTAYTYRVYAVDGAANSTHTASNSLTSLLSRPTGVTVTSPTASTALITWTDVSAAATSYHVERSTDGSSYSDVGAVLSGSANTYTDTGLSEGTQYYYRVIAETGSSMSNYSDVQTVTTLPATPTDLVATPFSTTEIDLAWTDVSTTNTSYTVERSDNGGSDWVPIATGLAGNANSFSDTMLMEATDHEYEVLAIGAGGNSALSNDSSATSLPNAPSNILLEANSASSVSIQWTDSSTGATAYEVQRFNSGVWTSLTTSLASNAVTYTDSTVTEGTAYQYRVRALRNETPSTFAAPLSVTTLPAAPSDLAVGSFTSSRVTLTWTDNSNGETGFTIERSTNGGAYSAVGTPAANSTTFSDNTVTEGVSYTYYIFASNAGGDSTNSATITAN
ncbi:MAG TPA: fibronectin type III domain-containing protein, partial [Tepidisphaeraceae bacterium]|nr:fibronectin type III domain-containing protein [Tepidisphaeraceae bacterium]